MAKSTSLRTIKHYFLCTGKIINHTQFTNNQCP